MTFRGTSSRFAVWDDMAMVERLEWVECPKNHPQATTIGALREQGWDIPPLVVVDQTGQTLHDYDVTVVASTALGTPEGREIVDRETFNAKIAGFEESNRKALENAVKAADEANKHTDAAINAVKDPAIRAALQALIGRKPDPKGGK
jgi:hypothetical protein